MEAVLLANVKKLYDYELYSCVIPPANLLKTYLDNERTTATLELKYQVLLYLGNAHYQERQYRLACSNLDSALLLRKTMAKQKNKNTHMISIETAYDHFNENETRYRLAMCYKELSDHNLAISIIEAVPSKTRTPKLNMLLAKLLHFGRASNRAEAVIAYKDLLRECPLALEAVESLLELEVDINEISALIGNATSNFKNIEWYNTWLKGLSQIYTRKHLEASKVFQTLNDTTKFHQNEYVLMHIGKCLYYYGNFSQAQQYLETALMINPHNMEILTPLSVVYEYNQKLTELEKITAQMTNINEFSTEHWFVLAQSFYANGKLEKASSFTHKSITVDPRNVEAQLLRGKICLQLKRHKDAIYFFRAAQCISNYRFEVYKGLFHCYVGLKRLKEAQTMCGLAVRYFRNSPRSYVMFARTLFHSTNPLAKKNVKKIVAKALEIDEHYAPAVTLMAEVCTAEGDTQEAISMLKKQVINYPHYKLFTMLGDILRIEKDLSGALEYYTIALSMDPTFQRAIEGVNALGQASRPTTKLEQDTSMTATTSTATNTTTNTTASSERQDEEWPIDCDEPSIEAVELSSPAVAHDDGDSDAFSDPFWAELDADTTN